MSKYKYFVFDYHTNKLGCLDLLGNADDSDFIEVLDTHSFRFYFNQKYFDNLNEFLNYLKHLNFKVAEAYIEDFGIKPPYGIIQKHHDAAAPCTTFIKAKSRTFGFGPTNVPDGHLRLSSIDDFFRSNKDRMFDIGYIVRMHNFIVDSMIIRPAQYNKFYVKLLYGEVIDASIEPIINGKYYFRLDRMRNDRIFTNYCIPRSNIETIVTRNGFTWEGAWPDTDKKTVYEIIDYINANYYAKDQSDGEIVDSEILISGFNISYADHVFVIKQHKNGKWYIDGDMALIVSMFGVSDASGLRKFVDKILGKKFRRGLFPECDSKEEIIKLLNEIKKCPT